MGQNGGHADRGTIGRRFGRRLLIMDADETRRALFDGRASKGQIAKLVVRCGGDENRLWNNLLRLTNPELGVRELPYDLLWDKEMMWGSGWR